MENFRKNLEEASSDEDIGKGFRIEEALMELDTKLGDSTETQIKVDNYK